MLHLSRDMLSTLRTTYSNSSARVCVRSCVFEYVCL